MDCKRYVGIKGAKKLSLLKNEVDNLSHEHSSGTQI